MLAIVGTSTAATAAAQRAKTDLTIQSWRGGVFGYVDSPRAKRCAYRRPVTVFKKRSGRPGKKVDVADTRRRPSSYQWSSRAGGLSGKVYARVGRNAGCRAARTKAIRARPVSGEVPACPGTGDVCKFNRMHLDIDLPCNSFKRTFGACGGSSNGGPAPWSPAFGSFVWVEDPNLGGRRNVSYVAKTSVFGSEKAVLSGSVPGPGSADYTVTVAAEQGHPDVQWHTPNLPGVRAGQEGGPLYLDFESGVVGADIYIEGYLYKKK